MSTPADGPDDDREHVRARRSGWQTPLKVAFGVTALPVILWCAFILYAIAKARYDNTPLRPQIPFFLAAAVVPTIWAVGAVGSLILARLGRNWVPLAAATLVPLVAALIWLLGSFLLA